MEQGDAALRTVIAQGLSITSRLHAPRRDAACYPRSTPAACGSAARFRACRRRRRARDTKAARTPARRAAKGRKRGRRSRGRVTSTELGRSPREPPRESVSLGVRRRGRFGDAASSAAAGPGSRKTTRHRMPAPRTSASATRAQTGFGSTTPAAASTSRSRPDDERARRGGREAERRLVCLRPVVRAIPHCRAGGTRSRPPRPPHARRRRRERSASGGRGGASLALDQLLPAEQRAFSCFATSWPEMRPRALSTSWTRTSSTSCVPDPVDVRRDQVALGDVEQAVGRTWHQLEGAELRHLPPCRSCPPDLQAPGEGLDRRPVTASALSPVVA